MRRQIARSTRLLLATLTLACARAHPPAGTPAVSAGYATVEGTVTDTFGRPIAGLEVLVNGCEQPIYGLAGRGRTDEQGHYSVTARVPADATVPASGLVVRCRLTLGYTASGLGVFPLRFMPHEDEVKPLVLNVVHEG